MEASGDGCDAFRAGAIVILLHAEIHEDYQARIVRSAMWCEQNLHLAHRADKRRDLANAARHYEQAEAEADYAFLLASELALVPA